LTETTVPLRLPIGGAKSRRPLRKARDRERRQGGIEKFFHGVSEAGQHNKLPGPLQEQNLRETGGHRNTLALR
jgi:hypothetical protein